MTKFFFLAAFLFVNVMGNLSAYELSIAAIFQNEGPYIKEWIEYHRMVGVEHFWLYNDNSKDNWKEEIQSYIDEGIVEVTDWPIPDFIFFIEYQRNAYRDALHKALGVTKWLALIDIDEYLLPTDESTVTECLNAHFSNASCVYVNWFHFGTGGVNLREGESLLFRLLRCAPKHCPRNGTGKSIVRPECIVFEPSWNVWNIHNYVLGPGEQYYNGDAQLIKSKGMDIELDGKIHDRYIRINHYTMKDENFFHNVRLVRAKGIGIPESEVLNLYNVFNQEYDDAIVRFILDRHHDMYEKFWMKHIHQ